MTSFQQVLFTLQKKRACIFFSRFFFRLHVYRNSFRNFQLKNVQQGLTYFFLLLMFKPDQCVEEEVKKNIREENEKN